MPSVTARVYPEGILKPENSFIDEMEITNDLPADVIGQCIAEAVNRAWKAGFDPGLEPFVVIVTFDKGEILQNDS